MSASRNKNLDGVIGINQDNLAMFRANYTVYTGGANLAKVREISYRVQEAYEDRNRTLRDLNEHMRLNWFQLKSINDRLIYLRDHKDASKVTKEAYEEQFKIGKRTLLDLLDAQNELFTSSTKYVIALHNELLTRYRIMNGMGILLRFARVPVPVEATVPEPRLYHFL